MDKNHDILAEWAVNYIKNKDIIERKIENIEKNSEGYDIFVKRKDKEQYFIIMPFINDISEIMGKLSPDKSISLVVFNSHENFEMIVKNWGKFADLKNFNIYFVNPFSHLDKKWIVYPYTHARISDNSSLERGLRAMFEMVEPITEEQLRTRPEQKEAGL